MGEDLMDWLRDNAVNDYSRGYLYQQALDEIERLRKERDELAAALNQFAECDLNESNCANLEVATRRAITRTAYEIGKEKKDE